MQLKPCTRCRSLKLRCDRATPCTRCSAAKEACSRAAPSPASASDDVSSTDIPRKTRRRACLSCKRCHRLKVKCDKKQPCSRCRLSGWGDGCEYTHRVGPDAASTSDSASPPPPPYILMEETPEVAITTWHSRHRGLSHWRSLLSRLGAVASHTGSIVNMVRSETVRRNHDCASGEALPNNFPFNSPRAAPYTSMDKVRELLETHRNSAQEYIAAYLAVHQPVHPVINEARFLAQVQKYWTSPSEVDISWVCQLLMVLALGQLIVTRDIAPTVELCMAAEACLSKTPFMLRPNIGTIRTLCLMVITIQSSSGTCWSFDACWNLMGLVVRLAMTLGFHRRELPPVISPAVLEDWEAGQLLWATIMYFNIQVSLVTGMPSCISRDDLATRQETTAYDAPLDSSAATWRAVMDSSAPLVLHILARINAADEGPGYEEVLQLSAQVRQLMSVLDRVQGPVVLRVTLDMFFRRVLLVLHRRHALQVEAPTLFPVSYWASLECSLALLVHLRELCDEENNSARRVHILCRVHMLDIFAAALTASIHMLRSDAPLAAGFAIPPRQTIFQSLEACKELWAMEREVSPCFRLGHKLLNEVVAALRSTSD